MYLPEVPAGKTVREEAEHQAVLKNGVLVELTPPLDTRMACSNAFVVAAQTESVYVQTVVEEAECTGPDAEIFVVVHNVFIETFVMGTNSLEKTMMLGKIKAEVEGDDIE